MPNILFVCTGNTCRSPIAAALLQERLHEVNETDWIVTSAGIRANNGEPATPYSVQLMAERGIDLSEHRSHTFDFDLIRPSALILCMEKTQVDWIKAHYPEKCGNIYMLSELSGRQIDVPDPYGGTLAVYQQMVSDLMTLIDAGLPRIIKELKGPTFNSTDC